MSIREKYRYLGEAWPEYKELTADAASGKQRIPNVVHYVLTDKGTGYFDWLALFSVKSAAVQLQPDNIFFHILDGIEPTSKWWKKAKKIPGVTIRTFTSSEVPSKAGKNGKVPLKEAAHVSDFYRMKILMEEGGIYLDTDVIVLQPFTPLLRFKSVFGEQVQGNRG
jgi:hypothetical protein